MAERGHGVAGLYVHVPFCARACPYCDFDFEVGRGPKLEERAAAWLAGLERERATRAGQLADRSFETLYIGGGTPSTLSIACLRGLFEWLGRGLGVVPDQLRERTMELNPEHAAPALLDAVVELGIDRVSLGIQSLTPEGLRQLGRAHTRGQALACIERCVARGLRTSADLIVGWPGQTPAQLEQDLGELVDAGVEHLSIYGLTIEPDTPWPKLVRRGLRVLPNEDQQADLLLLVERGLLDRGFVHYEVASYARPGAEAIHNGKYWGWADVIGLGPSAASVWHVDGAVERQVNARGLGNWLDGEGPARERLEREQAAAEGLWLGLRRLTGLDVDRFCQVFAVETTWVEARVKRQVELGNLVWEQGRRRLRVGDGRWLWHDSIAVELLMTPT
ncbi:putative radical SAM family enzyme [Enhygromyxa salina]|uniref:Putative radical SAM family enzyme n=1 Tax=Enhygromyxa salina TaxID=215803 RepID=A0A0C2CS12_9BACT|nr:coproporphyrinogen-III oxidase family protein [Enhygromyxa salina]KIG12440.1 putative radical SAM family enzyme [Enhygromyxa salina]